MGSKRTAFLTCFFCFVLFLSQTALAAIIIVNLVGMFKQFKDIAALWRTSKIEMVGLFMTASVNLQKSLATTSVDKDFYRSTSCFTPSGHLAGSLCSIGVVGAGLWSPGGHHIRLNDGYLQNTKVLVR